VYVGIKGITAANGSNNPMDQMDEETKKLVAQLMVSAKK
jgi:hypothetical protein